MANYIKRVLIYFLMLLTIIFIIFGCYRNLVKIEKFTESKTKAALSLPSLKQWSFSSSDNWYTIKQNGFSTNFNSIGITPSKRYSISFLFTPFLI